MAAVEAILKEEEGKVKISAYDIDDRVQLLLRVGHSVLEANADGDGIHKESVSRKIKELVPNSHLVVGMDARKWIPPIREFIKSFVSASYFNDPTAR